MKLLKREWFHGKRCMDIGCHTGDLTLQITFTFKPEIMIGVDIDHKVIAGAIKQMHKVAQEHEVLEEIAKQDEEAKEESSASVIDKLPLSLKQ